MSAQPRRSKTDIFFSAVVRVVWPAVFPVLALVFAGPAAHAATTTSVVTLAEQGLPSTVAHTAVVDGGIVSLPASVTVESGTVHAWSFPATVGDPSGRLYITTTSAGSRPVTGTVSATATYQTMAQLINAGVVNGTIASSAATPLKTWWTSVEGNVKAGHDAAAARGVKTFAAMVRDGSGTTITTATATALIAYAQVVYSAVGGAGTL